MKRNSEQQDRSDALKELRDILYPGAYADISEKTGFSKEYVKKVLNGERFNKNIIQAAIAIADAHSEMLESLEAFKRVKA